MEEAGMLVLSSSSAAISVQLEFVSVNERAFQTEGPSQRAKDDEPGAFLII